MFFEQRLVDESINALYEVDFEKFVNTLSTVSDEETMTSVTNWVKDNVFPLLGDKQNIEVNMNAEIYSLTKDPFSDPRKVEASSEALYEEGKAEALKKYILDTRYSVSQVYRDVEIAKLGRSTEQLKKEREYNRLMNKFGTVTSCHALKVNSTRKYQRK